mmetsp:Transcript_48429/g.85349  ORF Transcript_48429/g.85349 Transcript_48429/m.85349 type:complete len:1819 (+) Transcript_48429:195-5651(+)
MAGIGPDPDEADMEEADADSNRMVALYDFDPSTISWPFKKQRPLALQTGRVIQVDYDDGSQWALGHPVGQPDMKGYFPKNYTVSVAEYQEMMTKWEASEEALGKAESLDSGFGDTYPVGDTTYASASGMSSGLPAMSSTDREMPPVDETMEVEDLGGDFGPGYPGPPDSEPPYRGAAPTAWDLTGDPGREMPNISRGSAAETTAPPDDIAAALEEVKRENRKARENPRLVPGGMQTDSRASTPPTAQMIRPERDYVRRHLPPELQGMYMHKLSELPQVVKKRAPWKKVGKPTKVMFTAEPRVRATTLRIAHEIEPSNFRMAINNGGAGRWTQMFRPGFNDIVNESFKVGCNACILSRHYLNDADEQEKFRRLHVRDTNGINWFDLQRRKDHVYYQRMDPPDFVDVLMEHPAAWGFPDVNTPKTSSADPGKPSTFKVNANQGEPFDPMHGWYCQASIDTDKEMEEVEFCYNVRIRAFPERTFQALALGKMPEWIQSLANMSPDAPSLEEGDDLFSEKESGQARRIGEIDTELLHEAGLLDGDKVFSQARELIAPKEGEAKVAVGPDMLAAKMCSYRLKGISAMRIFMRSRANPDNMKQTLITPKMIIDFAAQLGIKGKFGDYWYCYFALRYALAPDWEVVVRNDTRYYLHLPSDRIQSIHPMIKRFREHLDDALQNEFLFDVREVVSKIREFQLKCSECGVPDAVVWCMQCTDYFCAKCFFDAHQSDRGKKHWPMPYPGARYLDRSEVERFREHIPLLNVGFSNRRRFLATDNQSDKMGSRSGDTWLFFAADSFQDALAQTQKRHVHLRRMNPPRLGPGAEGYYYNFAHGVLTDEPSHIMMKSHEQKALALLQKCIRGAIVRRRIKKEQAAVVVIQKCKMMWDCQKIYGNNGRNAEVLRAWYRRWKAKQDREKLEMRVSHTQAAFRGNAARTLFRAKMKAMTRFQAAFRGLRGRRHIRVLAAAIITIQRFYRGHLYGRRPMHEMHTNAARIQGMVRGVAFREDRRKRIEAATQIQAHIRGLHKRKFVKGMRSSAAKIQRNWRRFQAQLDVKIILYERLDNIRQKRQDIIRKKKSDAAATIIQRNWRRYVDFQHVIFLRREKNDADKRIQTLLVAVFTATGSLRHHVHPWWRHLPAELQEVLEKIKGSLQRTIAMVPVSGKIANEEVGKRGLRVADASCLTYVQTTKEPDLASHLLLSVTRHLLSLVPQELFPATVKWACYAIAHKAVDLVSIGHIPKEEIAVGKEMAPHPGDTLSTLWEETALVKHHHDHVMTLPDESMPCTVLYGFGGQHRQVFLTAEVLITMRQALDTPSLSTDDHLKFQGLDAVAGSQLMEVLGSELDHRLNKDWPKTYGTVAALATQLATHITEIQPEVVVAKAPKKPPTKAAKKAAKAAETKSGKKKSKASKSIAAVSEEVLEEVTGEIGGIAAHAPPPSLASFNRKALMRIVQQTGYFMRDQDDILQKVLEVGGDAENGEGLRQSRYISVTDKLFDMADQAKHDHCSFVLAVVLFHLVLRSLMLRVLYHRAAIAIQKRYRYIKEKGKKAFAIGPSVRIQRFWRGLRAALKITRQDNAAEIIQHKYKVYKWNQRSAHLLKCVLKIQKVWRGAIHRKWLRQCNAAATTVQKFARCLLVRVVLDKPGRDMMRDFQGQMNTLLADRDKKAGRIAALGGKVRIEMEKHRRRNVELLQMSGFSQRSAAARQNDRAKRQAMKGSVQPVRESIFEPMVFALAKIAPAPSGRYGASKSKVLSQISDARRALDRTLPREQARRPHAAAKRGRAAMIALRIAKKPKLADAEGPIIDDSFTDKWAIKIFQPKLYM